MAPFYKCSSKSWQFAQYQHLETEVAKSNSRITNHIIYTCVSVALPRQNAFGEKVQHRMVGFFTFDMVKSLYLEAKIQFHGKNKLEYAMSHCVQV